MSNSICILHEGMPQVLKASGKKWEVIEVIGKWDDPTAQKVTADALAVHKRFAGITTQGGDTGAVQALIDAKHPFVPMSGETENGFRKFCSKFAADGLNTSSARTDGEAAVMALLLKAWQHLEMTGWGALSGGNQQKLVIGKSAFGGVLLAGCASKAAQAKGDDKLRAIAKATFTLVEQNGLSGLTMAAIAREAGLGTGTLYVYFKSKEELLVALHPPPRGRRSPPSRP